MNDDLILRLKALPVTKTVGTSAAMALFFAGYFLTLRWPVFPVHIVPVTFIDRAIGFHPWSLPFYLSLWVYVSIAPGLLATPRELARIAAVAVALAVAGLAVFFLYPTAVVRPDFDVTRYPGFGFLQGVDSSGNACPSLHAAFALFAGSAIDRVLARGGRPALRLANAAWCLAILYSTIATRQHVAWDVIAGLCLGALAAFVYARMDTRPAG